MFKFDIEYVVAGGTGETRKGVVYAEDMDAAVHKICAVDKDYSHTVEVRFKEYPHWNAKGGDRT